MRVPDEIVKRAQDLFDSVEASRALVYASIKHDGPLALLVQEGASIRAAPIEEVAKFMDMVGGIQAAHELREHDSLLGVPCVVLFSDGGVVFSMFVPKERGLN